MSRGTIDFDFSLCNNSQDISGSAGHVTEVIYTAQTKLHLPVKSMFRQAFQVLQHLLIRIFNLSLRHYFVLLK